MSLVLCGPRRVYVLLVLWERLADGCGACPRALSSGTRVLGGQPAATAGSGCGPLCRLVMAVRLQRVLWKRLIGVNVLVLDSVRP